MRASFFFIIMIFLGFHCPAQVKIKVGIASYLPYADQTAKGDWQGYIPDILKSLAEKEGYNFQFIDIPILRMVSLLKKNEIDYAVLPGNLVRYLPDVEIISTPLGVSFAGALTFNSKLEALYDTESLAGKSIILTYLGPDTDRLREEILLDAKSKKTEVIEISSNNTSKRMMLMLATQRAEIALGDYNIFRFYLSKEKNKKFHLIPTSLVGFSSLVMVTRKGRVNFSHLNKEVNDWFLAARRNGRLDTILSKYNMTDWENLLSH